MSSSQAIAYVKETAEESIRAKQHFLETQSERLVDAASRMADSIRAGGRVYIMGNGGSAADAQHMAAEMVGRMLVERRPLPAVALTTDTSNLTAVGNDYGYDQVFVRQVDALVRRGDFVIAISTSGNSKNVLLAVEKARALGAFVLGITGGTGGKLATAADLCLSVSEGKNSSRIQETHIFILHSLVDLGDRFFQK